LIKTSIHYRTLVWSALFALAAALPLYTPFFLGVSMNAHDGILHHRLVEQIAEAHRDGLWYPRWMPKQAMGLGDATFMGYSPLFHTVSALASRMTGGGWSAMILVLLASTAASGFIALQWMLRTRSMHWAPLGAALLLEWNPLSLHLIFKAEAFPWASAFPLMLMGLILVCGSRVRVVPLAIVVAALTCWHILSAFMFLLIVPPIALIIRGYDGGWSHLSQHFGRLALACGGGLSLAGFYWIPALTAMRHANPLAWSFTGSCATSSAFIFPFFPPIQPMCWMSYQVLFPCFTLGLLVLAALAQWYRKLDFSVEQRIVAAVAGIALLMGSQLSSPLWFEDSPLRRLQFPSRWNSLASIAASLSVALALARHNAAKLCAAAVLTAAVLVAALVADILKHSPRQVPQPVIARLDMTGSAPEYLPSTARQMELLQYIAAGGFSQDCEAAGLRCQEHFRGSAVQRFEIQSGRAGRIRLPLLRYPAWNLRVNGQPQALRHDDKTGLILVDITAGVNQIELSWLDLPEVQTGNAVSLMAGTLLTLYVYRKRASTRKVDHTWKDEP
jgi:hypothetical protein